MSEVCVHGTASADVALGMLFAHLPCRWYKGEEHKAASINSGPNSKETGEMLRTTFMRLGKGSKHSY